MFTLEEAAAHTAHHILGRSHPLLMIAVKCYNRIGYLKPKSIYITLVRTEVNKNKCFDRKWSILNFKLNHLDSRTG